MKEGFTLITGAGAGIGKELAIVCAKKRFNLLLVSLPGSDLSQLASEISNTYQVKAHYFEIDLIAPAAPEAILNWCSTNHFIVDKLINNAGAGGSRPFGELQLPEIQSMILLNNYVSTSMISLFLPMLKQWPKAYILNVSSTASFFNIPNKALYAATKAFVNTLTTSLRNELTGTGVVVSVLCPGGSMHKRDANVEMKVNKRISEMIHENPHSIACAGIKGMLAEKRMILPGMVTKCYVFAARLVPASIADPIIRRLFNPSKHRTPTRRRRRKWAIWSMAVITGIVALLFALYYNQ